MAIHESRVNFENLIQDLAEMYPIDILEVVVVELVANSLDAKATRISIDYDFNNKVLVVQDNGEGMTETQFEEYHDFAAPLKPRGAGIGFAGLGAKISFNLAERVITETRSKSFSKGSLWYLQSKRKLVWEDIEPKNIQEKGTRVEVHFRSDKKISFKSNSDIVRLLYRHYLPLIDINFLILYEHMKIYSRNLRFVVNGQVINPVHLEEHFSLNNVRKFFPVRCGKRFGYGIFGLAESEYPISPDLCGVAICTYGKVIKGDLFNQFPGKLGPKLFGVAEIPELVNFLTTSKTDFVRKGKQRLFEKLYDPIRCQFKDWLISIGIETSEVIDSDEAIELEKELRKIIEDIPELSDFFGHRMKKDILKKSDKGEFFSTSQEGADLTFPDGEGEKGNRPGILDEGEGAGHAIIKNSNGKDRASPIGRKGRQGPKVTFDNRPDRIDLAWVEGNNIVINSGHPSYVKARTSQKTRKLHDLFAIASAIQRFLVSEGEKQDLMFVDRMMAAWGRK